MGRRIPVVSTAMGRAILGARSLKLEQARAFLDAADCQGGGFINSFDHECRRVHEQGYAVEIEENEPDIACVGVPVALNGVYSLVISVTMPVVRYSEKRLLSLARVIGEAVRQIDDEAVSAFPITPMV
ncbi:hypothetical protein JMX17_01140 [Cutibacterium avidum]|nr:hypothetical protein [Cutibacterium avidum]QQY12897.1 hypothetical protein JMX17_01140 [Cutibacterium avidum]